MNTHTNQPMDKDNILPSLLPAAQNDLKKKIAGLWNSRRTAKQIEDEVFYSPSDVKTATIEDVIRNSEAKRFAQNAAKYRASKAIRMADFSKKLTLICPESGIVSVVDIPAVPGFFLEYINPLSILPNARLIVQRGYAYLIALDTQVLAGLLITLADDYSLFQYPTFSNGTNKNALLRSAGKTELIHALLFIEEKIHSENYSSLPKLSFIADSDAKQGTMEARLHNWLSIIQKELEAPTVVFPAAPIKSFFKAQAEEKKHTAEQEKKERKALLSFNKELSEAISACKTLCKDGLIDQKLRNLLISFMDKDVFSTLESGIKAKVSLKLATLPIESRITQIIKIFERETISHIDRDNVLEDFSAPPAPVEPVKIKTSFELQNNPEVIRIQKEADRAKRYARQHEQDTLTLINSLLAISNNLSPAQCSVKNQLLLTMDPTKTNGYSSILLNGDPIPEGRFQLKVVKEAFEIVKNWKAPAPVEHIPAVTIIEAEQTVDMTDIGNGIMAPTLLWNSMSSFKQTLYKRKMLMASGK